jgi:predicted Fe-Mo cluster-binding NifX family protein
MENLKNFNKQMIKIVAPTNNNKGLNDNVAEHFGRCNTYTFLDENGDVIEVIKNTSEHMGGIGLPPELMKKHGANILLCRGLGPRALNLCGELGIEVYVCQAKTVRQIFELWKNKKIKRARLEDACKEHKI